jgi:hypothetical protein
MDPRDRFILESCAGGFRPLKPLSKQIPSGSLYRRAKRLVALGWLRKENNLYQTGEAGLRQLAETQSGRRFDALTKIYPPLALVPTPVHRALAELIIAGAVARKHAARPDRHPVFVAFGGTLHWKTSLGTFVCHALGLDPALHIVDCGAETGKSLTVRRTGRGEAAFKRELLAAPFVVLDEFSTADTAVRATLGVFLSGRLVVPFENEQLRVCPVPLLTLNPRQKSTLEQQIGLSAPQIRRAILANLDAVPMPDLAVMGEQALEAARTHSSLVLATPAVDCRVFHERIVELTRAILAAEAYSRIDVEIVTNLATGMTTFISDPTEAIAQVAYNLAILAETVSWTRPGWIEAVAGFSVTPGKTPLRPERPSAIPTSALANVEADGRGTPEPSRQKTFSLEVQDLARRKRFVPNVELSDATLLRLVWFAHETDRDTDGALNLLFDFYVDWRGEDKTIETIERVLTLAQELGVTEVEAQTLHDYLADRQALAAHNCSFTDLPEALRVLELLAELPTEWDWDRATAAMKAVADLVREGVTVDEIGEFIAHHRRLEALGFNETAEALATALSETGAVGDQRDAVIRHLVEQAKLVVDRDEIEAAARKLEAEVALLEARKAELERTVGALAQRREVLRQEIVAAQRGLAEVEAERAVKAGDLDVLAALRASLLRKAATVEPLFEELRKLDRWRKMGGAPDDLVGAGYVKNLREKLLNLIAELIQEAGGGTS